MSTANDPASAASPEQQPPSPNDADAAPAPDADKAEPAPHERPPVRTDDN